MKKILSFIVCAILLIGMIPSALAIKNGSGLPYEIREWFGKGDYADLNICDHLETNGYCFVLGQYSKQNTLFGFKMKNGEYKFWMSTIKGVPQGKNNIHMYDWTNSVNPYTGNRFSKPAFAIAYCNAGGSIQTTVIYTLNNGAWRLRYYENCEKNFMLMATPSSLTYYNINTLKKQGTAEGTVQTDVRYVNLSSLPRSLSSARDKLTTEPNIPRPSDLSCESIQFTGGKKYSVYSGPGESYLRSGNGKAAVSTNDWIQVFGMEGDWILIQYAISSDHMRFGYIPKKALPKNADVYDLDLAYQYYTLSSSATMTDDPLFSRSALKSLNAGTEILYLGRMGSWAYVETTKGERARGFVPLSAVNMDGTAVDITEDEPNYILYDDGSEG